MFRDIGILFVKFSPVGNIHLHYWLNIRFNDTNSSNIVFFRRKKKQIFETFVNYSINNNRYRNNEFCKKYKLLEIIAMK